MLLPAHRRARFLPPRLRAGAAAAALLLVAAAAAAAGSQRLQVRDAWARATVEGQTGSGAYMKLTSDEDAQLVGASSPVAAKVEIHEMRRVDNRMTMRRVESLALPAHETVALEHGYHVMLIGLRQQLQVGQSLAITLQLVDARGHAWHEDLRVPVRPLDTLLAPTPPAARGPAAHD